MVRYSMAKTTSRRNVLKYGSTASLVGLAGCLGGGSDDETDGEEDDVGEPDEDDIEATLWHSMSGAHGDALESLVKDFNDQDNGYFLHSEFQGEYGEAFNSTMAAARDGNAPDLVQMQDIRWKNAIDSGLFEPVEENLPDDIDYGDYFDFAIEYCSFDGQLMSFPSVCAAPLLFYNQDALDEVGADEPSREATFGEVREIAQDLVDGGFSDEGIVWNLGAWYIEQWFCQQDQIMVNNRNGRDGTPTEIMLDTEASYNIFEWWSEMVDDELWLNVGTDFGQGIQSFVTEDVGMAITSNSALGALQNDADFEVGTAFMPVPEDGPRAGTSYGGATFLTRDGLSDSDEQSEVVGEFLVYFNSSESQSFWHRETGYLPNNVGSTEVLEDDGWFDENPNFITAFEQFEETETTDATQGALIGAFPEVRSIIDEETPAVVSGDDPVEEGLDQMKSRVDERLQQYADDM